jgi:hypothetical protein
MDEEELEEKGFGMSDDVDIDLDDTPPEGMGLDDDNSDDAFDKDH